ncbi:MAG: hypothetical protein ACLQFI_18875 [Methylocella sp.]|jgi:hypothetical protein
MAIRHYRSAFEAAASATIGFRVEPEAKAEVFRRAAECRQSPSEWVREAVSMWLGVYALKTIARLFLALSLLAIGPACADNLFWNSGFTMTPIPNTGVAGALSGSVNLSPTTPVNLTSLATSGNSDWAHWGFGSSSGFDHKSGAGHISNVSLVGGATSSLQYTASAIGFTWTDGTPDGAETNTTTFIYCAPGANGRGYSFTVPADTTTRTLLVWIAAYDDTMLFTATLSDSSAGPYSDSSVVSGTTSPVIGLYAVTYNAASSGQTLTISVVASTNNNTAAILSAVLN